MKKITTSIILLVLFFASNAQTDSIIKISLDDAVLKGLEYNYQILIGKKDLEISKNNNTWGKAGVYPTVTAGVSQSNRFNNSENILTGEHSDVITSSVTPNLNAQMILFNGFAIRLNKKNLEAYEEISEISLKMTLENTVTDLINAYYSVLLEEEKLKVVENLMKLSKDRYEYFLLKKELGVAVTYDVLQLKNNFLTDSSNYLMQLMNKRTAVRELSKTLGDTELNEYIPTDTFVTVDSTYSLGELESLMLENNTALQTQYLNKGVVENSIKLAKSSMYPSLSLNVGADHTNSMIIYIDEYEAYPYSYGAYANLSLSYTIFNGNNRKRDISNARIEAEKLNLQIEELEMVMRNNLFTIWQFFENRKQLLKVAEENFTAAKLNLNISKEKFDIGAINSFNYRDVQIAYINTAYSLLQAKYNLITTHTDLKKITGRLISK
ncbi:MAG: TolC family protein [Bacteroidales bacterium]|nr:TolC family protein [Bacteroidales bacterium]